MAIAHNRIVLPTRHKGEKALHAASRMLADLNGIASPLAPSKLRALKSVDGVRNAVLVGKPVLLSGRLPTYCDLDGYMIGAIADDEACVALTYNAPRKAFRVVNTRGVVWGQRGRAWLTAADLERLLHEGVVASTVKT
jgi:hypothetical protein